MIYESSRWISETPRYGFKWINITLTMNEFVVCIMVGVGCWLALDMTGVLMPKWWAPFALGIFSAVTLMAIIGSLSKGKPGSYLWDYGARFGLAGGGRGAITRSTPYTCDAHEFVSATGIFVSAPGIWGRRRDHVGPRLQRHQFSPPSRLGGRFCLMVPCENHHVSLCDVFGGERRAPEKGHGAAS